MAAKGASPADCAGAGAAGDGGAGVVPALLRQGSVGGGGTAGAGDEPGLVGLGLPTSPVPQCLAAAEALASQWRRRRGLVRSLRVTNLITGERMPATNVTAPFAAWTTASWMAAKSTQEVPNGR